MRIQEYSTINNNTLYIPIMYIVHIHTYNLTLTHACTPYTIEVYCLYVLQCLGFGTCLAPVWQFCCKTRRNRNYKAYVTCDHNVAQYFCYGKHCTKYQESSRRITKSQVLLFVTIATTHFLAIAQCNIPPATCFSKFLSSGQKYSIGENISRPLPTDKTVARQVIQGLRIMQFQKKIRLVSSTCHIQCH